MKHTHLFGLYEKKTRPHAGWWRAVELWNSFSQEPAKADELLVSFVNTLESAQRRLCQSLFFACVKHSRRITYELNMLLKKQPKRGLRGVLYIAVADLILTESSQRPKVVHFTVDRVREAFSKRESGMVNAVLRRVAESLDNAEVVESAILYSHPDWLYQRWCEEWGADITLKLMQWNNKPAPVYGRFIEGVSPNDQWEPTEWECYYRYTGGDWATVESTIARGELYIQDPSTRWPVELLEPKQGERILDLCAAPGGKSVKIAQLMKLGQGGRGGLVCVDLPGKRLEQLKENLSRFPEDQVQVIGMDILDSSVYAELHENAFDAVLIDVPCSNTGVLRRRADARWRIQPEDLESLPELQLKLLTQAAKWVKPNGRLVYSTCSIESDENTKLVEQFIEMHSSFKLKDSHLSYPWQDGHDGGAAFLLELSR